VPVLPEGQGAVIHAEIWPSFDAKSYDEGMVKDQAQVIGVALNFRDRDRSGSFAELFTITSAAAAEEGWILGVVD
jgi:hypothetical protein